MGITISLGDILQFALGGAGVVLLIYLVIMIKNLNTVLNEAKSLITKNSANLDRTIQSLPGIAGNVESITGGVKNGVTTISKTAEKVDDHILGSSGSVVKKAEITVGIVQMVGELVKLAVCFNENKNRK